MRVWTLLLSLIVLCLVSVNATAQEQHKKHSLADRFAKMDANHDGILTLQEFVAGHPKLDKEKAEKFYNSLVGLGGSTTKDGATGMTLEQFRKGHKAWREAHPKKPAASN